MHFTEEYEAYNPIMRALREAVHEFISRDNDTIFAALQVASATTRSGGPASPARVRVVLFVYGTLGPGRGAWSLIAPFVEDRRTRRFRALVRHRRATEAVFGPGDDVVHGWCCTLVGASLEALDEYEGDEYARVTVRCTDGTDAIGYHWVAPVDDCLPVPDGSWGDRR